MEENRKKQLAHLTNLSITTLVKCGKCSQYIRVLKSQVKENTWFEHKDCKGFEDISLSN